MKKFWKILGISFLSLLAVAILAIGLVCFFIFTPERLTSIARTQSEKYITSEHNIGKVDLALIKTFPHLGVNISDIIILNPKEGAQSDTLLFLGEVVAKINAKAFLQNNEIIVDELYAKTLNANIFIGNDGVTNLDVLELPEKDSSKEKTSTPFTGTADMDKASFNKFNLSYRSLPTGIEAKINGFNAEVGGKYKEGKATGKIDIDADIINADINTDSTNLIATLKKLDTDIKITYEKNFADIELGLSSPSLSVTKSKEALLSDANVNLTIPVKTNLKNKSFDFSSAKIALNEICLGIDGSVTMPENGDIVTDASFSLNEMKISDLLAMIPTPYDTLLNGIDINGIIGLSGRAKGIYNSSSFPLITANVKLSQSDLKYEGLPISLYDINGDVDACLNLNDNKASNATINSLSAKTGSSAFSVSGKVAELLSDNMKVNVNADINMLLKDVKDFLPDNISAEGRAKGKVKAALSMDQLQKKDFENMKLSGSLNITDLIAKYDTIHADGDRLNLDFTIPNTKPTTSLLNAKLYDINNLNVSLGENMKAFLKGLDLSADLSNIFIDTTSLTANVSIAASSINVSMETLSGNINGLSGDALITLNRIDTTAMPVLTTNLQMNSLAGVMSDTISFNLSNPKIALSLDGTPQDKGQIWASINYNGSSVNAIVGDNITFNSNDIILNAQVSQDSLKNNVLSKWNPNVSANIVDGFLSIPALPDFTRIPLISFELNDDIFRINESNFVLGYSDFRLVGEIDNLAAYLEDNNALLSGEFNFTSQYTDVNYFMDLVNGFGVDVEITDSLENIETAPVTADTDNEPNPFMVPMGVDFVLNTNIQKALINDQEIENVGGKIYVKDGTLVLEEMGFVSEATRLQLTAIYQSPRKNHLFVGLDYHMLDIDIDKLIEMIPDVDTVLPMLKAFKGTGEFHLAAETYLTGNYDLKKSTLRGACSMMFNDVAVLDNETFNTIRKLTMMGKNTENKIDSLNAEITVFREEVDVYPLMVSMGRYQAIAGGRHNLDMTYDYHLSLTKSPLPFRLGVNVFTKPKGLRIKLARCKYSPTYRPEKQYVVDARQRELREIIRQSLRANVVE